MLNNVLTAWSHTESKRFADKFNCHGFGIVLYNAVTALPLTLLGAVALGEWQYTFHTFEHAHNPQFWASVAVASFMGVIITYIVFLCTTVNGPLVTSITGNAKDVLQTVLGAVLFHDFVPTAQNVVGIVMSFCGAGLFTWTKLRDALASGRREAQKKADSAVAPQAPAAAAEPEARPA
jgi:drug/metabolite transporter (DMT)-like permease